MLAALLLALLTPTAPQDSGVQAQWRCEPGAVEVGEPFALVLEFTHSAEVSARELFSGELGLDDSWVVLGEEPLRSLVEGGGVRTRRAWRVASLEPGERALTEALASVSLSEQVSRIRLGDAHVSVAGVLAEGEDEPRPLREFPPGFGAAESSEEWRGSLWIGLIGLLGLGTLALWLRRRARALPLAAASPLERFVELERQMTESSREGCYALTRLLREASDGLRKKPRPGLTDEEWLVEVSASLEVPRNVVAEISAVFERASRVKYAGEAPTPWALQETFQRARGALEGLGGGGAPR